jgi:hypothetical protein
VRRSGALERSACGRVATVAEDERRVSREAGARRTTDGASFA